MTARTIKNLIDLVAVAHVLFWLPSAHLFCLYAMGRSSRCPYQKAVSGPPLAVTTSPATIVGIDPTSGQG